MRFGATLAAFRLCLDWKRLETAILKVMKIQYMGSTMVYASRQDRDRLLGAILFCNICNLTDLMMAQHPQMLGATIPL